MSQSNSLLPFIMTIDGPSASGKGTVAKQIAKILGFKYLDSGAIYRIYAWFNLVYMPHYLQQHTQEALFSADSIACIDDEVFYDDIDITQAIRTEEIGQQASKLAQLPQVRQLLLQVQQNYANSNLVADGRDMGTIIFKHAQLKILLHADAHVRAQRRLNQLNKQGIAGDFNLILQDLQERDKRDITRKQAPLKAHLDAVCIETSQLSIDEVCHLILAQYKIAIQAITAQTQSLKPMLSMQSQSLHYYQFPKDLNATIAPIVPNISHACAYTYNDSDALSNIYQNKQTGLTYARTGSTTAQILEQKLAQLESSKAAITFSTGMAAYDALFFTMLKAGSKVAVSQYVFANTLSLLKSYQKFGVEVVTVDITCEQSLKQLVDEKTNLLLVETIANPCTQVPNWSAIMQLTQRYPQLILVVDNTITTPFGFKPKHVGAHLIIHSLTKSIMGHSRGLGGAIIDTGLMNWQNHPLIEARYQQAAMPCMMQIRKKGLRDKGATLSAQHADLALIGLETLKMRVQKANENAHQLAHWLAQHTLVKRVMHPSLHQNAGHLISAMHYQQHGFLLSFELQPNLNCMTFLQNLNMIKHCSSIGDNRSLIIDVATTIFAELTDQERLNMGINEQTLRLSVGIEAIEDLILCLDEALHKAK